MMGNNASFSRRAALRGLGLSLGLPLLPSLAPKTVRGANLAAGEVPRRMAFIFVPNGVHVPDWTPQRVGFDYELPFILEPLKKVRESVAVLTGLTHDRGRANGDGAGDHARSASVFLTGAQPRKTDGANIRSGVSVDQLGAQKIGHLTRFPSLELGCERGQGAGNCDSGYSCAYSSNISWAGPSSPVGKEVDPRLAFERMFAGGKKAEQDASQGQRLAFRRSILDYVADDAKQLQKRLGGGDQKKLDEYLTSVREIERRVELASQSSEDALVAAGVHYPTPSGIPGDYAEHLRLMCDMVVLAFQTDSTRIATLMFANAGSNRPYKNLDVSDGHHELSHHGGDAKKHAKIRKINQFHVAQLAYLLERLRSIPEGNGNLLDHSMIVYGSGLSDGDRHNHDNLPVLLCGGGGGEITSGRHIRYEGETPMCNLFLSMLDIVGAPADWIGDSTGRLPGLKV